ncbi:YgzB family protein [Bacillaceae bacterium]
MLFSSKINKLRNIALSLVFLGVLIMYIGYAGFAGYFGSSFHHSMTFMAIFLVLGFLMMIASCVMYMWVGMLSTKAVRVVCPTCGKTTKILGALDECMFCKQALTLDPKYATEEQKKNPANG